MQDSGGSDYVRPDRPTLCSQAGLPVPSGVCEV